MYPATFIIFISIMTWPASQRVITCNAMQCNAIRLRLRCNAFLLYFNIIFSLFFLVLLTGNFAFNLLQKKDKNKADIFFCNKSNESISLGFFSCFSPHFYLDFCLIKKPHTTLSNKKVHGVQLNFIFIIHCIAHWLLIITRFEFEGRNTNKKSEKNRKKDSKIVYFCNCSFIRFLHKCRCIIFNTRTKQQKKIFNF